MTSGDAKSAESQQFWEELYGSRERVWSGRPNAILVREVTGLTPGRALDLGCGEGADAIWLAQQGWHVTAVDVSPIALRRARDEAVSAGVGRQIEWQQHDLTVSFPEGVFDLVSAQFLHSPIEFARERVLQAAARAVAPGGRLLVVGHAEMPPWSEHHRHEADFPTPQEVLKSLQLVPEEWQVEVLESPARQAIGPDGQSAVLTDSVLRVMRLPA